MLLASIAMVNVPVKAEPETRLYIRESPPGSYKSAEPVDSTFYLTIDIESPSAWDNTENGIVGYELSVHVDPNVLEFYLSGIYGATSEYWLFDFAEWNEYTPDHTPYLLVEDLNATTGELTRAGELLLGYETLGVGAGTNSGLTDGYGEAFGLARLRFKSKTATGYTPIDIYDAYWVDINGDKHAFDVVDDGQYNQEPVYLTVESTPINYTDFTIDSTTYTTNTTIELQPDTYTVTMPNPTVSNGDLFTFVKWEDDSTNPVRTISLTSNMTITATYAYGGPPLEANLVGRSGWKEHAHFDVSKHGNTSVTDPKGTDGYQTLFAKIKNIGEGDVLVRAKFELVVGVTPADEFPMVTTENMTVPGEIIILTVDFAGKDGYPWETEDEDTWKMRVICEYYVPAVGWLEGTKIKTSKFNVVP